LRRKSTLAYISHSEQLELCIDIETVSYEEQVVATMLLQLEPGSSQTFVKQKQYIYWKNILNKRLVFNLYYCKKSVE